MKKANPEAALRRGEFWHWDLRVRLTAKEFDPVVRAVLFFGGQVLGSDAGPELLDEFLEGKRPRREIRLRVALPAGLEDYFTKLTGARLERTTLEALQRAEEVRNQAEEKRVQGLGLAARLRQTLGDLVPSETLEEAVLRLLTEAGRPVEKLWLRQQLVQAGVLTPNEPEYGPGLLTSAQNALRERGLIGTAHLNGYVAWATGALASKEAP